VTLQPQFTGRHVLRSGADDPLCTPSYATVFEIESSVCFQLRTQPNILKSNQAIKTVILTYTSKQKP